MHVISSMCVMEFADQITLFYITGPGRSVGRVSAHGRHGFNPGQSLKLVLAAPCLALRLTG